MDARNLDDQSHSLAVCPEFQQLDLEVMKSRRGPSASGPGLSGSVTTGASVQPAGCCMCLPLSHALCGEVEMDQGPGPPCLGPL